MRLVIETHCLNEAEHIGQLIRKIPRTIQGIDEVKVLVIDDGSTDNTHQIALDAGADFVIRNFGNKGIPYSLNKSLEFAREHDFDILVNMDADDQHDVNDIPKMIAPILNYEADLVHGERNIDKIEYNGVLKKIIRKIGSSVVSWLVGMQVKDASSGFRALNKEAIRSITLLYDYQEPLEYIIQAKHKNLNVKMVEINPKPSLRPSRLFSNLFKYIWRSALIIIDNAIVYRSTEVFLTSGLASTLVGLGIFFYRVYLVNINGSDNLYLTQLIASIVFLIAGVQLILFAFIGRLLRANRILSEKILAK